MKKLLVVVLAAFVITGCGTVSSLKSSNGTEMDFANVKKFDTVIVETFQNKVTKTDVTEKVLEEAGNDFADMIVKEIKKNGTFKSVERTGTPDANTLVINGNLTKYVEGSAAARLWVGFGAGSSYFDADVNFIDGSNNKKLAEINVDKNSWALGGGAAMKQTPEGYMNEAAKKIGKEVAKLSTGYTGD